MADSNPDAENPDAVTPGENPDAVAPGDNPGAVAPGDNPGAVASGVPELDIPDADLPELAEPALALPEPQIPDPVIPSALLAEPVIPPAPADASATRGDHRSAWTSESDAPASIRPRARARLAAAQAAAAPVVPEPSLAPEDVVPPESGASSGSYRGLTVVIFGILFALLIGAVVLVAVLLSGGVSPFPDAASIGMPGAAHAVILPI